MRIAALLALPFSGASVSQHAARIWALRNTVSLETGWRIFSVTFYGDETCTDELVPEAFLDGGHLDNDVISFGAHTAFDGKSFTVWVAQCGEDSSTQQPCSPYEAWIGADFGSPVVVYCVTICQSKGVTSSPQITLSKEGTSASSDGSLWVDVKKWNSLPETAECVSNLSGISKMSAINYAPAMQNKHCAQQAFDQYYTTYATAKAFCDQTADCVGIYDQECGPMTASISFQLHEREKWHLFLDNLDGGNVLRSSFNDNHAAILAGSSVNADDQSRLTADAPLPRTIRMNLASIGKLKLCKKLPNEIPISTEGSCLHLKTGAILEFVLEPNTRGIAILLRTLTVSNEDECAEACVSQNGCQSFLQVHKTGGDETKENNCQLQGVVESTEALDGSIDVADLYIKKGQPETATNEPGTITGTNSTDTPSHAWQFGGTFQWGILLCLLYSLV